MTNREWLNTLSDEELGHEMASEKYCIQECPVTMGDCSICAIAWLKQEHKEENHDD